jgi:hypothetical protein
MAVAVALGATSMSDIAVLAHLAPVLGAAPSGPAIRRTLNLAGTPAVLERIARARAKARAHVRKLIEERSFRMAKSDLQARPVYHRKRGSIEAHLTIVLAALAVSRWIEHATGWSIRKFVKTARRYRTIQIQAGPGPTSSPPPTRCLTTCARQSKQSSAPDPRGRAHRRRVGHPDLARRPPAGPSGLPPLTSRLSI